METRAVAIPPAGISDFSYEGMRTASYPSYFVDKTNTSSTVTQYEVSPQAHQAVLNEIAARPSNFGYGLGHALRRAFESIKATLKNRPDAHGACAPEDKLQEETATEIENCVTATGNLLQRLSTVEKAEEAHLRCLQSNGVSLQEARVIQQSQRPGALQIFLGLFSSVESGPYRQRQNQVICQKEAEQAIQDVREAEKAEQHQQHMCKR